MDARPRMLPCPNCGFLNEADDSFCGNCRRALQPEAASSTPPAAEPTAPDAKPPEVAAPAPAAAAPAAPSSPAPANIVCPRCGTKNDPDDRFCGNCGGPLGEAAAPAAAATAAQADAPAAAAAATVVPTSTGSTPAPTPAPAATSIPPTPTPTPAPTTPIKPGEIACPNCGTSNASNRLFCVKCATPLRAEALPSKKPPFRLHRGMVLPFVLSAVIGLGATVGGARIGSIILARSGGAEPTAAPGETTLVLTGGDGEPVGIDLTPADPKPLDPLPDNTTIRVIDYEVPTPSQANDPDHKAPWWNDTVPRIPAISQFDGGPLQKVNCVMASGAMLARLAFGIVTTGSQLRALQTDQDGASSYTDLNDAVERGWGVGFTRGLLSPLQLRALSYSGAGMVVSLNYGAIPENIRVQRSFTGNHSVYVDAFTPDGPNGGPAYYVIDPIGKSWQGYKGEWWPAADVERAGLARLGEGKIYATWAFAGGIVPDKPKVLPPDAFPDATPGAPTAAPTDGTATPNPFPSGDIPVPPEDPDTGTEPPEIPQFFPIDIQTNVYIVEPKPVGLACTVQPIPATCPGGIVADVLGGGPNDPFPPPINNIAMLYGNIVAPNTVQVVFDAPPDTTSYIWTWSGMGLPILQSISQPALIGSNTVSVANISVSTSGTLSFFATSTSPTFSGISTVGTLVVGG